MAGCIKTAVFGGTFNPLHNGHLAIAQSVLEQKLAQEVWMLVTPCNPWKSGDVLLDDQLRLNMVREAVKGLQGIVASDFEFTLPKPSYSASTLLNLSTHYPEREFILTIGADNWVKFQDWREADFILQNYNLIVYPRPNYPIPDNCHYGASNDNLCSNALITERTTPNVTLLDCPLVNISSTAIRNMVRRGEPIDHLVPAPVASTIHSLHLFT